jgi:HD-like signal output (HDOD) protein
MKKRILFVDDQSAMLLVYELALKHMADEWQLFFAANGVEALQLMARTPIDVVVSELCLPRMDGVQFLNEVALRYPHTIRFVLSARFRPEDVAKCINAVHQFLRLPCDMAVLKAALVRACALDVFANNVPLKRLIGRMTTLPSLPSLYYRILQELQSPGAPVGRIAAIASQDPGITVKLLQFANSAYLGMPQRVYNLDEAIHRLGVNLVRSLALCLHTVVFFEQVQLPEALLQQHWSHWFRTGTLARTIVEMEGVDHELADEGFIAGLLHDVGKLLLLSNLADQYEEAMRLARSEQVQLWQAEQRVFGATHAEVGAYLLGLWGLPVSIIEAVALHHDPARAAITDFSPLTAVHVANVLEHESHPDQSAAAPPAVAVEYLKALKLDHRLEHWRERCLQA